MMFSKKYFSLKFFSKFFLKRSATPEPQPVEEVRRHGPAVLPTQYKEHLPDVLAHEDKEIIEVLLSYIRMKYPNHEIIIKEITYGARTQSY